MSTSAANEGRHLDAVHGADGPHVDQNTGHHDPHLAHHFDTPEQQFSTGKLGMWTFLATEVLMFGGLFCAYAVYRSNHPEVYLWAHQALDAKWGMINTIVLLASSFTMAWGVRAAQLNQKRLLQWMLVLTFLGGLGFMAIKTVEYKSKWEHHLFPGRFNSLNAEFKAPEGKDAGEFRRETILAVESHGAPAEGDHGPAAGAHGAATDHGESGDHDKPALGQGNLQDANAAPMSSNAGEGNNGKQTTATEGGGSAGGAPRVADNSPNPQATQRPAVAAGMNVDQPATSQPVRAAASALAAIGTIQPGDGHAGTPDAISITPPAFVSGGINAAADVRPGHQQVTYAQMQPTDRAQLNAFFSIYFMMTGLHGFHVIVGMGLIAWLFVRATNNEFSSSYFTPVDLGGLYWHLVDLIWIFLFPLLYLIH